jgi:NAD(P)-dependent dehydrogenase (short-subunit alcohol dehydrogenase family)
MKNKVALITGGTSGIGHTTALAFAREGAKVAISGRREKEGNEVVAEIKAAGGEAIFIKTDIVKDAEVKAMVEQTVAAFGQLDYAFNNAGVEHPPTPTRDQTEETFEFVMNINVKGVWLSQKYEIAAMLANGGGAIVNNASVAGLGGMAGMGIYVASKHAVIGLTKATALEVARKGIRVNAVAPAAIETRMFTDFAATEETQKKMASLHPIGRIGKPEEIAEAVVFLCSDKASFITGETLAIDGGWTAQ